MSLRFDAPKRLRGEITVPGDKSISHRGVMFGSIADGLTELTGFLPGADCVSTINCFRRMGIEIEHDGSDVLVHGRGLHGLTAPADTLDAGNSGTTTRLISGILSGQNFPSEISGDESLSSRPMKRIIEPLSKMGAEISSTNNGCLPLSIKPAAGGLHGITYNSPVASAQVKSCVLLAGLYADSPTTVIEPALSRDHTERMLRGFGADVETGLGFVPTDNDSDLSKVSGTTTFSATIKPEPRLTGQRIKIPGDISSAAYFIAAGLIHPDAELLIKNVGINPTRAGIIKVAMEMGGDITLENRRTVSGEDVADILVCSSDLRGIEIGGDTIPTLIDEIPMIAVMAAKALSISNEDIIETIDAFKGVEHRIEFVRELNGVKYYNDSKGTNTDATITALDSFEKNVILLVGGYEKGLDMSEMRKHLGCVKKIIGYGAAGYRISHDLVNDPIVVTDLNEAVQEAVLLSKPGDIVLLSPTTSSFDQYSGYEERGRHFKEIVNAL